MRLLVTRPQPDAQRTAASLETLGHTVLIEPMTTIVFAPPPEIAFSPTAVVFTSSNGVRAVSQWPMVSRWRKIAAFAVGEQTGLTARAAGFAKVEIGGGDAASLADMIIARVDASQARILYISGRERSVDLASSLAREGIEVVTIEGYYATAAEKLGERAHRAMADGAIDGVLIYSHRAATIFLNLVEAAGLAGAFGRVMLYVISESAAEPLRPLVAGGLVIAAAPNEKSLIAAIGR
ncbi:MAG: uroporphyrinogen-III synthase [Hyphomicrobiales bacterium]|nr:uroporphyrinogen-III synthase [Hyphomicrobiales bacterium]